MRILRLFSTIILLSLSLYAVPKFFFVRTYGTPDGARYDAQRNLIYVGSPQTSQVLAVSPDTGQVLNSAYVPNAGGLDITPDGKQLVVGTTAFDGWYGDTFLTFVDLDTFTVAERTPISNPMQEDSGGQLAIYSPYIRRVVALYNGNILCTVGTAGSGAAWVGKYDRAKHTFSVITTGNGLIPSDDRKHVLLPNMGYNAGLQLFDAEADTVTVSNPGLNNVGVAFSHDGKLVAYSADQNQVLILDATTLQPIRTIATPNIGVQIAFSLDNSRVFVEKSAYSAFYVLDVNTGLLQGAISMPYDIQHSAKLLGMDSRGMLYSSLSRGLAVTDSSLSGFFEPQFQFDTPDAYVASPSAGPITGGTSVTVHHSYSESPTIYFADKIATITGSDSTGIRVTAPPGDRPGPVDITLRYADGAVAYISEGFSYGPTIEHLYYDGGSTSGGDSLTLFALGLRSASATNVHVQIGGAPAIIDSVTSVGMSPTYRISLKTPSGNAGPADVVLVTEDGSATLKGGFGYARITNLGGETDVPHMLYDDTRGYLYRCEGGMNRIEVLDTATGQYIKQYLTHPRPVAMALSPDRSTLYVTASAGSIDVIDLNTNEQQSIQLNLPAGMTMTRIGLTSKGTLFVGIYNPDIFYDSRLIEVNPSTGSFTTRLQHFNGNYLELGLSRDGTRAFISSDLAAGASGNVLYYWDAFTDSFRSRGVPGWFDYGINDDASLLLGGGLTYDSGFNIHNTFQTFDFIVDPTDGFVWGEKLDDSGAIAIRPSRKSLIVYDVHHGNRIMRLPLPSLTLSTVDAMSFDSDHGTAYISSTTGLFKVELPNLLAIGRIEPAQGLTSGGQTIVVRGIGFQQHATVTIGGQPVPTQFVNGTTLQVTTPALPLGTAEVQVTNDDGRNYSLPGAYSAVDTQPIIATTSPSQLRIGDGLSSLPFSIAGMNFFPGAVALWNGSPRSTYFTDDTELHVDLKAADTVSPGAATLTVRNPDGGLSNEITIAIKDYPYVSLRQSSPSRPNLLTRRVPFKLAR